MYQALPAIEWLIAKWTKCLSDPNFDDFYDCLEHALSKVSDYYDNLKTQPAYLMCMGMSLLFPVCAEFFLISIKALNPRVKLKFVKKNWTDSEATAAENILKSQVRSLHIFLSSIDTDKLHTQISSKLASSS